MDEHVALDAATLRAACRVAEVAPGDVVVTVEDVRRIVREELAEMLDAMAKRGGY